MLKPISGNGMIAPMKAAFVLDQLDSIRTHKDSIFAVMRGAAACVADALESRPVRRPAIVVLPPETELSR